MPIRTIIVGDQEAINKINKLAKKYNLSALIKLEILNHGLPETQHTTKNYSRKSETN